MKDHMFNSFQNYFIILEKRILKNISANECLLKINDNRYIHQEAHTRVQHVLKGKKMVLQ